MRHSLKRQGNQEACRRRCSVMVLRRPCQRQCRHNHHRKHLLNLPHRCQRTAACPCRWLQPDRHHKPLQPIHSRRHLVRSCLRRKLLSTHPIQTQRSCLFQHPERQLRRAKCRLHLSTLQCHSRERRRRRRPRKTITTKWMTCWPARELIWRRSKSS